MNSTSSCKFRIVGASAIAIREQQNPAHRLLSASRSIEVLNYCRFPAVLCDACGTALNCRMAHGRVGVERAADCYDLQLSSLGTRHLLRHAGSRMEDKATRPNFAREADMNRLIEHSTCSTIAVVS